MTDAKTQKWNIPTKSGVKFVGDTNFWISATFWRGLCYRLKQLVADGTLAHVTSLKLLSEFARVLRRDFNLSDDQAYIRYNEVMELSEVVYPQLGVLEQITGSRNHADNPVLECAVWGEARYVVTRD